MNKDFWRYVAGTLFTLAFISTVIALIISPGDKAAALVTIAIVMTGALILVAILPRVTEFAIRPQGVEAKLSQLEDQVREQKEQVETLTSKVKQIEEKFTFETPQLEQELNSALSDFRAYLQELGFKPPKEGEVKVRIQSQSEVEKQGLETYYDPKYHQIVIAEYIAWQEDAALHEYTHHALISPKEYYRYSPVSREFEAGLALYFPCSFKDSPLFANLGVNNSSEQSYRVNLELDEKFTAAPASDEPSIERQGEIWGGAFWEMRILLGQKPADKLLFTTWSALKPSDLPRNKREDFARKLLESAPSYGSSDQIHQIQAILERRGLKF